MKGGIVRIRDVRQLPSFDLPRRDPHHHTYTFMNRNRMDYHWMERQIAYIDSLNDRQKHMIYAYTIYGDELMNQHLRGTLTQQRAELIIHRAQQNNENPLKYQHHDRTGRMDIDEEYMTNLMEYVPLFTEEFTQIIHNAPKLTRQICVFRGIRDGQFIVNHVFQNQRGVEYFHYKDFISTSFYLPSAVNFMDPEGDCCLMELILEPNVPCLLTAHVSRRRGEYEITIAPDTYMGFKNCKYKLVLDQDEHYDTTDILIKPYNYDVGTYKRVCVCLLTTTQPIL